MKQFSTDSIRNVALLGHGGSGKTSLAEAMLYLCGESDRLGKIADGNTVMDFDSEEKRRKSSISTAVASVVHDDTKINIIDTAGLFDFEGSIHEGLSAADLALIVISGKSGVTVGAEKTYHAAAVRNKARMFFVSKLDSPSADFHKVYNDLSLTFGTAVCPVVVPYVQDGDVKCYVNLITSKAYTYENGKAVEVAKPELDREGELMRILYEAVATSDDELMEKYFNEEPFTTDELLRGLRAGVSSGSIAPVFSGSGTELKAIEQLLWGIVNLSPAPDASADAPLAALVFKTVADPFVGKLSYFKVLSGTMRPDCTVIDSRTGASERIGKLMYLHASKQEDAPSVTAGDIGAVAKLSDVLTGDALCDPASAVKPEPMKFPLPCLSMAVIPKQKGDEEKIAQGILRLEEEDPTISFEVNKETHQQLLSGLGEQHLDVIRSKLKAKFGVDIDLEKPKVAYRETIRKKVKAEGKHKKQTGGHGQFGHVWIEFEPCDSESLVFEEKVFGGSVPKGFFPAVEKGLVECVSKGVLAGYPMVGVKATLVDGSYHPVDSSEMAFKMAAALAYKAAMPNASPVLLEPINTLKITVDDNHMGDVIGELNKRRGRVLGMTPAEDKMQEIEAEAPASDLGDFSTALRAITQGRGSFTQSFSHYEEVPAQVAQGIIAAASAE